MLSDKNLRVFREGSPKRVNQNPIFVKARTNILKQRLRSLNSIVKGVDSLGAREGHKYDGFHMGLSRGLSSVAPTHVDHAKDLHEFGPFAKQGGYSVYLGNLRRHYWRGRNVVLPFSPVNVLAWFLDLIPPAVKQHYKSVDRLFVSLASYMGTFITLYQFSKARMPKDVFVKRELLNIEEHLHRLKLPSMLRGAEHEDIFHAKVTLDTHPGILTRSVTSSYLPKGRTNTIKITKANILHYCVNDLINAWDKISKGDYNNTIGTYCIGSREKIQKLDIGTFSKTRPLFIPESCDLLHGSTWLELFKENWQKYGLFNSEIWLGHGDQNLRFYRRLELDKRFKYSFEFDGKNWDSSVMSELILYAFNIYCSCFEQNKSVINHFRFLYETMVFKRIILHNGNSFLLFNGVPSGHAWTSHINSLVNWIIWTSTIHNCPFISKDVSNDYELQIQGDDIVLHTNVDIRKDVRLKVCNWMLHNFNYEAKDETIESFKNKGGDSSKNASFLKRHINSDGMLDTQQVDIWEKILLGPEYSGLRGSRVAYFLRRINDLAIAKPVNVKRISLYYSFINEMEIRFSNCTYQQKEENYKTLYRTVFFLSDAFTCAKRKTWQILIELAGLSSNKIIQGMLDMKKHIENIYVHNYLKYDSKSEYVDYWKEGKKSVTVSQALKNFDDFSFFPSVSIFDKLHSGRKRNIKVRRRYTRLHRRK